MAQKKTRIVVFLPFAATTSHSRWGMRAKLLSAKVLRARAHLDGAKLRQAARDSRAASALEPEVERPDRPRREDGSSACLYRGRNEQ